MLHIFICLERNERSTPGHHYCPFKKKSSFLTLWETNKNAFISIHYRQGQILQFSCLKSSLLYLSPQHSSHLEGQSSVTLRGHFHLQRWMKGRESLKVLPAALGVMPCKADRQPGTTRRAHLPCQANRVWRDRRIDVSYLQQKDKFAKSNQKSFLWYFMSI